MSQALFESMRSAVVDGETEAVEALCAQALAQGLGAVEILNGGFIPGMNTVGQLYADGDAFLPELVQAAEVMKAAMALLEPHLARSGTSVQRAGRVLLGTVSGDIHDIGKSIVGSMLSAHGFDVRDLGTSVPLERFVAEVKAFAPHILGLSSLVTTTMPEQQRVVQALEAAGLRGGLKVIVGGAPVTAEWATRIGADGYAEDAIEAVTLCRALVAASA